MICEYNGIQFALENRLVKKLDLLIERVTISKQEQNAYLGNHGDPGEGKTNSALVEAMYVKSKTGRDIHLYFGTEKAIEFAKKTEKKIIIVDEPSLDNLSTDQLTRVAKNFLRLVNMSRIKRHFTIVNLTKFWRFPKDLVCDALKGMVHMDTKDGKDLGRFKYIRQKFLEPLYNDYQKFGKKRYAHYMSFGGRMPFIKKDDWAKIGIFVEDVANATYNDYEKVKTKSIELIGDTTTKVSKKEINQMQEIRRLKGLFISFVKSKAIPITEVARFMNMHIKTLRTWGVSLENQSNSLGNQGFEGSGGDSIVNTLAKDGLIVAQPTEENKEELIAQ